MSEGRGRRGTILRRTDIVRLGEADCNRLHRKRRRIDADEPGVMRDPNAAARSKERAGDYTGTCVQVTASHACS